MSNESNNEPSSARYNYRVPPSEKAELRKRAQLLNRTETDLVRAAVRNLVKKIDYQVQEEGTKPGLVTL